MLQTLPTLQQKSWMPRLAFAPHNVAPRGDTLVVIFLRGAADILNMVVPHGEEAYYAMRPTLGVARPDDSGKKKEERVLDLDGFFGFHPSMNSLLDSWYSNQLAIIHACGAPDESRSHFKAMELMERGVDDERGPASGWIGRHLATLNTGNSSPLRAVGMGTRPQRSLSGSVPVSALRSIADFHLGGDPRALQQMRAALNIVYEDDVLGQDTLSIMDTLETLDPNNYQSPFTTYPDSEFGLALKQTTMLIKAEVGLEVSAIDVGGWDTHFAQGSTTGIMPNLMKDLADGMAAFHADMQEHMKNLTVVTMSEFGRRASENGSLGTDHGHGSMMMVMGGNVDGGKVHGEWPGLEDGQMIGPGDLAVTTDYRDVLSEVLQKRLNNPATDQIFPDYSPVMRNLLK
ncbi:MAG: DUF1501 domain-containing protein [Anaerolineae bacterium]|nr:DUF1501 domain-containing protein [Anaerolineae bacterium]MBL8104213.1 DUF1501 domain-containing protein [Anaerolineales bacterium]MCC7189006.1 DUF1501 domain-containing protein [Anaerolineales bacterium]